MQQISPEENVDTLSTNAQQLESSINCVRYLNPLRFSAKHKSFKERI